MNEVQDQTFLDFAGQLGSNPTVVRFAEKACLLFEAYREIFQDLLDSAKFEAEVARVLATNNFQKPAGKYPWLTEYEYKLMKARCLAEINIQRRQKKEKA